jgi:hypothetical protein
VSDVKSAEDTDFETLCSGCQSDLDLNRPQFHGQMVFKGHFTPLKCDRCGGRIEGAGA